MRKYLTWFFLFTVLPVALHGEEVATEPDVSKTLAIGMKAPEIDIETWVSKPVDKKNQPPKRFLPDHVYVIDFWATWCIPCIAEMPHLAELQELYANDKLTIISITNEPSEAVKEFLDRKVDNSKSESYRELTKHYYFASDPDKSSHNDYIKAAKIKYLPAAFIIGKSGQIEWIGNTHHIDIPLKKVINGTWDRTQYANDLKQLAIIEAIWIDALMGQTYKSGLKRLEAIEAQTTNQKVINQIASYTLILRRKHVAKLIATNADTAEKELDLFLRWKPRQVSALLRDLDKRKVKVNEATLNLLASYTTKAMKENKKYFPLQATYAEILCRLGKPEDSFTFMNHAISDSDNEYDTEELMELLKKLKSLYSTR